MALHAAQQNPRLRVEARIPIPITRGEIVEREKFWVCDLAEGTS